MTISNLMINNLKDKREISNFILFILGKFVSIFGTSIYAFAMGLYVLKLTSSALNFATTLVLSIIPMVIVNPFAGVMADRFDKKKLVVIMDLANGVLLITLYALSLLYGLNIQIIYVSTFIMTIFTTIFGISFETAKPNIVSDKMLMKVNSISKVIDSICSILGPVVGGLIFSFIDIKFFVILNGVSFILSGISEMFIDFNYNHDEQERIKEQVDFFQDIKDGFKYMAKRKKLLSMFGIFISLNFFMGLSITIPMPFIINNVLNLGSKYYGIIEATFPIGIIIGAIFVNKVSKKLSYSKLLIYTSFILSLCMIMIGLPVLFIKIRFSNLAYLMYYSTILVVAGIAISFIDIPIISILQRIIPDEYRGRVLSIGISIGKIILPAALIVSGLLINSIPAYILTFTGGFLLSIINTFILKGNNMKDIEL